MFPDSKNVIFIGFDWHPNFSTKKAGMPDFYGVNLDVNQIKWKLHFWNREMPCINALHSDSIPNYIECQKMFQRPRDVGKKANFHDSRSSRLRNRMNSSRSLTQGWISCKIIHVASFDVSWHHTPQSTSNASSVPTSPAWCRHRNPGVNLQGGWVKRVREIIRF